MLEGRFTNGVEAVNSEAQEPLIAGNIGGDVAVLEEGWEAHVLVPMRQATRVIFVVQRLFMVGVDVGVAIEGMARRDVVLHDCS